MDKQIKQIVESIIFLRNIWKSWNNSEGENNDYYSIFFHDEGIYHIETSPLILSANLWTGFYRIGPSLRKLKF